MTKPIGIQLYTLRALLQDGFPGIIEQLAAVGYAGVESFGGIPVSHAEAARIYKANGLDIVSAHLPLPLGTDEHAGLSAAEAYNLKYYVNAYQPPALFQSRDSIVQLADQLNAASQVVQRHGMRLAYHNHEFEFFPVDGQPAYDLFIDALDPAIVLEVDIYWAQVGGQDPAALIQRLGDRAPLLHIKDGPADLTERDAPMTAVGQGKVDIAGVIHAAQPTAEWLIVELDAFDGDMLTAVKDSFAYLTEQGLGHGKG